MIYKNVRVTLSMSKECMIAVPDNATEEQIINKAKLEIILPNSFLQQIKNYAKMINVNFPCSDLDGWEINDVNYGRLARTANS
jgi:hypothetical protein